MLKTAHQLLMIRLNNRPPALKSAIAPDCGVYLQGLPQGHLCCFRSIRKLLLPDGMTGKNTRYSFFPSVHEGMVFRLDTKYLA